jgi:predicted Fe-Mo cluster-binding NifX family protein
MKKLIAFPSNDGVTVEEHFGHCRQFVLITTENGEEVSNVKVDPPAHAPGVYPNFLAGLGATAIITGGMGGHAVSLFKERNIEVILGAGGLISENLKSYLQGDLESGGSICTHHEGGCH